MINKYTIENGSYYKTGPYTIDNNPVYPVIFGANCYDNTSLRKSPVTCVIFQGDKNNSIIRNPLLQVLFTGGDEEYSFKIIQSVNNIPMETLEPDSDTIYPNGNISANTKEERLARFTGVSDEIDLDTLENHYWHDLLYDPNTGNLVLVGNGSQNILVSNNCGLSWEFVDYSERPDNQFCLYQARIFQDVIVTIGEEWTDVIDGQNYYSDSNGILTLQSDSDMIQEYDKYNVTDIQNSVLFTPTVHNNAGVAYIKKPNETTWVKKPLPMANCRSIITSPDKLILIPGDGSVAYYTENNSLEPGDWVTINLPGDNRSYTGSYANGKYVLFSIDNKNEFYYSNDGITWNTKPISEQVSWYCCEYIEKYIKNTDNGEEVSWGFLIGSVNGYIGFIDGYTLEYTRLYYKEDTHWYDIKKANNLIMVVGGCGNEKRIAVRSDDTLSNWFLKKSSISSWHNICYCPRNNSYVVVAYNGNDGGSAFINYFEDLKNNDLTVSINSRIYINGQECYNLPDDYILPQESGFNSIKFSPKLNDIGVESFDTGSIIRANNYYELAKHLFEVLHSYYHGARFTQELPINNPTPFGNIDNNNEHGNSIPKAFNDFIGTYGNGKIETFDDFLNICNTMLCTEFPNIINILSDNNLIDRTNIPQKLLPIYGETEMKTHNWVPGELVYKDNQETANQADQMMIGIKAIMDLLSKR